MGGGVFCNGLFGACFGRFRGFRADKRLVQVGSLPKDNEQFPNDLRSVFFVLLIGV